MKLKVLAQQSVDGLLDSHVFKNEFQHAYLQTLVKSTRACCHSFQLILMHIGRNCLQNE